MINWFFKNLAAEILRQNPKIEIRELPAQKIPIAVFESNDLEIETKKALLEKEERAKNYDL